MNKEITTFEILSLMSLPVFILFFLFFVAFSFYGNDNRTKIKYYSETIITSEKVTSGGGIILFGFGGATVKQKWICSTKNFNFVVYDNEWIKPHNVGDIVNFEVIDYGDNNKSNYVTIIDDIPIKKQVNINRKYKGLGYNP